jgi:hydrogenase maturation protein HypF
LTKVQHHYAHILSCMAEHKVAPPALGLAWDGTGYGDDGTIWGGEFLLVDDKGYRRVAHLRPFLLPGGDTAVREPRRAALGLLYGTLNPRQFDWDRYACLQTFTWEERRILQTMLDKGLNTVATTSMGRLFDAVAALLGLHPLVDFEAQAAMALEFTAMGAGATASYHFAVQEPERPGGPLILDPTPIVLDVLSDQRRGVAIGEMAGKFHNALIDVALNVANKIGVNSVVLSGGCFQNALLTEGMIYRLYASGFTPYWPQQSPPNDGGIALGQVVAHRRGSE